MLDNRPASPQESVREGAQQRRIERTAILYQIYVATAGELGGEIDRQASIKTPVRADTEKFLYERGLISGDSGSGKALSLTVVGILLVEEFIQHPDKSPEGFAPLNATWHHFDGLKSLSWPSA